MKFHGKGKNTSSILFADGALTFETYKNVLLSDRWAGVKAHYTSKHLAIPTL